MLDNATLLRVDSPPAVGPGGDRAAYTNGQTFNVRCLLDTPTFTVQRQIDLMKLESTDVLYVEVGEFPNAPTVLIRNTQVLVQMDGMDAQLMRVDNAQPFIMDGVSHLQCFLRAA